ncbi:MAG: sulfatase-like hydrolase/transferase [Bacteroidales bacterium]|nr:sulfatase-like hydrolase/transferase [Bacteroidales bacterium]
MGERKMTAPLSVLYNLLLAYILFFFSRILFYWINYSYFTDISFSDLCLIFKVVFLFDNSAILYLNIIYIFLMLFPFHKKETKGYQQFVKGLFVTTNSIGLIMNLMDTVYFQYTNRRTTASVFNEFSNEGNIASIIGTESVNHWYLILIGIGFIFLLYKFYKKPSAAPPFNLGLYYIVSTLVLLLAIPLCIWGMRGGIGAAVRPITISNANQYVRKPIETALVLNTPFSVLRTIGKKPFIVPAYLKDEAVMEKIYTPLHLPSDTTKFKPLNVVVLIMESFGKEYIGALNGEEYDSYTPFLDSLIEESLTFEYSFANGRKSIDGMPSIVSGIPMFVEPFFLVPASLNDVSGLGGELRKKGYYTAFFHGAKNGSMGFEAYAKTSGYTDYFGRTEYNNDKDFDGKWAIWDEEFLQFFADKLSGFQQPFSVAFFSATSHHPYVIPERYKNVFPEGSLPIHKCVRYSDYSLKRFFERISKEEWFENTVFVITADHTNQTEYPEYQTESGVFAVPVIFYHPGSDLRGHRPGISQQIDIMPTVLSYLGYDNPYITFGCDLLTTPPEKTFAVNYINGIYQYFKGDYLLHFDGEKPVALYKFTSDILLQQNLLNTLDIQSEMEVELKAIIQQYMLRMNGNQIAIHD